MRLSGGAAHGVVLLLCAVRAVSGQNGSLSDDLGPGGDLFDEDAAGCANFTDAGSCTNSTRLCVFDEDSQLCAQPCELLSKGDSFGALVQAALAVLALCVLLIKRNYEEPKRPIVIWACDVSKQCVSMACAHIGGMVNAIVLSGLTWGGDQCSWYLISFTVDTTVGVTIAMFTMRLVAHLAGRYGWSALENSGDYGPGNYIVDGKAVAKHEYEQLHTHGGDPFKFDEPRSAAAIWLKQVSVWCIVTVFARACCGVLMYLMSSALQLLSEEIADVFIGHPKLFLTLVMLGCPVCMNLIQVWVQDNILSKFASGSSSPHTYLVLYPLNVSFADAICGDDCVCCCRGARMLAENKEQSRTEEESAPAYSVQSPSTASSETTALVAASGVDASFEI